MVNIEVEDLFAASMFSINQFPSDLVETKIVLVDVLADNEFFIFRLSQFIMALLVIILQ
jgi:hypothetical protein